MNKMICMIILFLFISCETREKERPKEKKEVSKKLPVPVAAPKNIRVDKYERNGLQYEDKYIEDSLIQRKIFEDDALMFISPIRPSDLPTTQFRLLSGRDYLIQTVTDTLEIINESLPIMNTGISYVNGTITRISNSSFLIKTAAKNLQKFPNAKIYIHVYQSLHDDDNIPPFICDSLILPIKLHEAN